jgi:tetratricopeptide (TPR) repeat protein
MPVKRGGTLVEAETKPTRASRSRFVILRREHVILRDRENRPAAASIAALGAIALLAACRERPAKFPATPQPAAAGLIERALRAEQDGKPKDAEALYTQALAADTAADLEIEFRARFALGTLLLREHRPDEARPHLERATKLRSDDAPAWYNLGLCFAAMARDVDAVFPLMQAVSLDPTQAASRYNLGFVMWRSGRRDEAKMHLEIAAGQNASLRPSVDRLLGRAPPPAAQPPTAPSQPPPRGSGGSIERDASPAGERAP